VPTILFRMAAWQHRGGGGVAVASGFGSVLPSLPSGPRLLPGPPGAQPVPPRPAPTATPAPAGPPGDTGTPPRTAFATARPATSSPSRPQRFGKASVLGACVFEAAVVVPTLHVEVQLAEEPWPLLLRILIAIVRLYPIVMPCVPLLGRAVAGCGVQWREALLCRRLSACFYVTFIVLFCPEVRWGVAITLDMWYLLTTPLNKGLSEVPCIILLVANIILCFVDTLTLIMMLAVKSSVDLEPPPERDGFSRPRPVKLGSPAEEGGITKFDPTCIICLSDFKPEDDILQLPCDHTFHTECISKWLSRSRHCPLRCPPVVLPPRVTRSQMEAAPLTVEQLPSLSEP